MEANSKTISNVCFDEVDFGVGIRENDGILSVRWPGGVYLKLKNTWAYHLTIERDGYIFKHQIFKKNDDQLLLWIERWAKDISNGRYSAKKTERQMILDIITERNLTSDARIETVQVKWKKKQSYGTMS